MYVWKSNSFAELHGAPAWFLGYLATHLSIPVQPGTKPGARFGRIYNTENSDWGSLLVGRRIPAGLTGRVLSLAAYYTQQGYSVPVEVVDQRVRPPARAPLYATRGVSWRPYQDYVHQAIMAEGSGVIDAVPRSGKTLMAARAIDEIAEPVIYLAPSVAIVRQTYEVFCGLFGSDLVSRVDGTANVAQRDIAKLIVVATVPSALKLPRSWWAQRRMLIIDEFHHSAAESYYQINDLAEDTYYRLCFTGTHWRTGGDALAMEGVCSHVLARIDVNYLVERGYLTQPYVQFDAFRAPPFAAEDWRAAYETGIVNCALRNDLVTRFANQLTDQGHQVIVLVNRRDHADALGAKIRDARVAKGGEGALTSKTVKQFVAKQFPVLVGTSVLGEGVDVPTASALLYAGGLGDSVQAMQSYYRPLTASPGKTHGLVFDFYDQHHPTLQRQAEDRMRLVARHLGRWLHVKE